MYNTTLFSIIKYTKLQCKNDLTITDLNFKLHTYGNLVCAYNYI